LSGEAAALLQGLQAMGMDAEKTAAASVEEIAAALKAADKSRPATKQYAAVEVEEARRVLTAITDLADEHKPDLEKVPLQWMKRWDLVGNASGRGEHYTPDPALQGDHQELKRVHQKLWEAARDGQCDEWELEGPKYILALIIILDQFSRIFIPANDGLRYEGDFAAQTFAQCLVQSGVDVELSPIERLFAYLPLLHAEHIGMQEAAKDLFTLLGHENENFFGGRFGSMAMVAANNIATLQQFGRFPQRNAAMLRKSTPQELAFLNVVEVAPPAWNSDT